MEMLVHGQVQQQVLQPLLVGLVQLALFQQEHL
jgi:hypothetical protein